MGASDSDRSKQLRFTLAGRERQQSCHCLAWGQGPWLPWGNWVSNSLAVVGILRFSRARLSLTSPLPGQWTLAVADKVNSKSSGPLLSTQFKWSLFPGQEQSGIIIALLNTIYYANQPIWAGLWCVIGPFSNNSKPANDFDQTRDICICAHSAGKAWWLYARHCCSLCAPLDV